MTSEKDKLDPQMFQNGQEYTKVEKENTREFYRIVDGGHNIRRYGRPGEEIKAYSGNTTILFDHDKTDIKGSYQGELNKIAAYLKENQNVKLYIEGHTDTSGDKKYNIGLSNQRAGGVYKELVAMGVDPRQLSNVNIEGKGETNLAVETPDGVKNEENRRVTVAFSYNEPHLQERVIQNYLINDSSLNAISFSSNMLSSKDVILGEARFVFDDDIKTTKHYKLEANNLDHQSFYVLADADTKNVGYSLEGNTLHISANGRKIAEIEISSTQPINSNSLNLKVVNEDGQESQVALGQTASLNDLRMGALDKDINFKSIDLKGISGGAEIPKDANFAALQGNGQVRDADFTKQKHQERETSEGVGTA